MFNTLVFAKRLTDAGVPREQAEAHAQAIADVVETEIATKRDIEGLKVDLKNLEYRLMFKLTTILSAIMGTMITILGFAIHR